MQLFDVILDRDGTLNIDSGYLYRPEDCVLTEGAVEALTLLRNAGARFSIATGQSGIARGMYSIADMHAFNKRLVDLFKKEGIEFAAIAFCPHHPSISECNCRKPKTGMCDQIEAHVGNINWKEAWTIGDKPRDSQMMFEKGGRAVLLRSGPHNILTRQVYWDENDPLWKNLLRDPRNFVASAILEAAHIILKERAKQKHPQTVLA